MFKNGFEQYKFDIQIARLQQLKKSGIKSMDQNSSDDFQIKSGIVDFGNYADILQFFKNYSEEHSTHVFINRRTGKKIKKLSRVSKNQGNNRKGRSTDIGSNLCLKISPLNVKLGNIHFNLLIGDPPQHWTTYGKLLLWGLHFSTLNSSQKIVYTLKVTKILNKMIKFRIDRLGEGQRIQFHTQNKQLLEKIKKLLLLLLERTIMPEPEQILIFLSELVKCGETNKRSLKNQILKICQGFTYILRQLSIYQAIPQGKITLIMANYFKKTQFCQFWRRCTMMQDQKDDDVEIAHISQNIRHSLQTSQCRYSSKGLEHLKI